MAALFFAELRYDPSDPQHPGADRFVLSKGHAAPILYAAWAEAGLFDRAEEAYRAAEEIGIRGVLALSSIDMDDAEKVLFAIRTTPDDQGIDIILHTPGGLVIAALQIARALKAHKGKVTVFVPHFAMSGGTLIALAADEIVLGEPMPLASFVLDTKGKKPKDVRDYPPEWEQIQQVLQSAKDKVPGKLPPSDDDLEEVPGLELAPAADDAKKGDEKKAEEKPGADAKPADAKPADEKK